MENWEQQYMGFGEEDPSFVAFCVCECADYNYLIKLIIGDNGEFFLDSIQCFLYSSLIINYYY